MIEFHILFGGLIALWLFSIMVQKPYVEPDEIDVHPKLEGKELDQWLKLYEGISIQYARSIVTEHGIAEMTWEAYGKLTGKEIWEAIPNPDKVAHEA